MAFTVFKTFISGEVLTASDLNSSLTAVNDQSQSIPFPRTQSADFDGQALVLDSDGDSQMVASTDDRLDFQLGGVSNLFRMDGTTASTVNGIHLVGTITATPPEVQAAGSDTNIGLKLVPKGTGDLTVIQTDAGAGAGPIVILDRDSSSQADDDVIGEIRFNGRDDAGTPNTTTYARIQADVVDSTDTEEDGGIAFGTNVAGTVADRVHLRQGLYSDGATGGDQGADSANFSTVYEDGTRVMLVGKHTIWIPAGAIQPAVTNGCSGLTQVETTAGRPDMNVQDFDQSTDEHGQFHIALPKSWNLGTVTYQVWWTQSVGAVSTGVAWALQGVAVSDNETIDVAYGTAVVVTDDAQGAVEEVYVTPESSAVTIAGTPADDDLCFFQIFRDVSDANDDLAGDARLLGLKLFITYDTGNDA